MQRITLRVPADQLEAVENLVDDGEYANRSAAIRAGISQLLEEEYEPLTPTRTPAAAEPFLPDGGHE